MDQSRRRYSLIFLILGLVSLAAAFAINAPILSWAAIAFVLISLVLGGRWRRPRR